MPRALLRIGPDFVEPMEDDIPTYEDRRLQIWMLSSKMIMMLTQTWGRRVLALILMMA